MSTTVRRGPFDIADAKRSERVSGNEKIIEEIHRQKLYEMVTQWYPIFLTMALQKNKDFVDARVEARRRVREEAEAMLRELGQ